MRDDIQSKYSPKTENLLLILTEIQDSNGNNSLSAEDIAWVAGYLKIPLSAVYGVVTYYSLFSTSPRGRYVIRVCRSPVCTMLGADRVMNNLQSVLGIHEREVSDDGLFSYEKAECLGQCEKAPAMMINRDVFGKLTQTKITGIITAIKKKL